MTKSPGTHVEPLAAAAKHGGRLLPLARYRHPPECPGRANCLPGLKRAYGLRFMAFVPLDAGRSVALLALAAGYIDVTLLFTADPGIPASPACCVPPARLPARLPARGLSWRGGNRRLVAGGWLRAPGLIPAAVTCVE